MSKIWKCEVPDHAFFSEGAIIDVDNVIIDKVIHADFDPAQNLCIWLEVKEAEYVSDYIKIFVRMTGENIGSGLRHINTVMRNGIVAHIYTTEDR